MKKKKKNTPTSPTTSLLSLLLFSKIKTNLYLIPLLQTKKIFHLILKKSLLFKNRPPRVTFFLPPILLLFFLQILRKITQISFHLSCNQCQTTMWINIPILCGKVLLICPITRFSPILDILQVSIRAPQILIQALSPRMLATSQCFKDLHYSINLILPPFLFLSLVFRFSNRLSPFFLLAFWYELECMWFFTFSIRNSI